MGTLTVGGMSAGLASGQKVIGPVTMTGSTPIGQIDDATLSTGDNDFSVPTGAAAVAIFLGQSSSVNVEVRTNLNLLDGGLPVGQAGFVVFPLATGVTRLVLSASASLPGVELTFI